MHALLLPIPAANLSGLLGKVQAPHSAPWLLLHVPSLTTQPAAVKQIHDSTVSIDTSFLFNIAHHERNRCSG